MLRVYLGDERDNYDLSISYYNTFHKSDKETFDTLAKEYGIAQEDLITPALFIGDDYMLGYDGIEEEIADVIASSDSSDELVPETLLVYFYVNGCKECVQVKAFMDTMEDTYTVDYKGHKLESTVNIVKYEIGDPDNLALMYSIYDAYNVPKERQFVPIIFMGQENYLGIDEISRNLIDAIESGKGVVEDEALLALEEIEPQEIMLTGQNIAGVLTTGLINGFNPCSISMILFLFSLLLSRKVNVLKLGFAFIIGKFITYVLLGTVFYGLLSTLNIDWLNTVVKVILIVLFLVLSLMNFLDFFAAKNENYGKVRMQLPAGLRKMNHNIIKKITDVKNQKLLLLLCFLLGVLISVGEFLCTGQIYLATILYVLQNSAVFDVRSLTYFVLYSFMFVVPLIVITVVIHKTKEFFSLSEFVREKMHLIKLLNAILFLLFVVLVVLFY